MARAGEAGAARTGERDRPLEDENARPQVRARDHGIDGLPAGRGGVEHEADAAEEHRPAARVAQARVAKIRRRAGVGRVHEQAARHPAPVEVDAAIVAAEGGGLGEARERRRDRVGRALVALRAQEARDERVRRAGPAGREERVGVRVREEAREQLLEPAPLDLRVLGVVLGLARVGRVELGRGVEGVAVRVVRVRVAVRAAERRHGS